MSINDNNASIVSISPYDALRERYILGRLVKGITTSTRTAGIWIIYDESLF